MEEQHDLSVPRPDADPRKVFPTGMELLAILGVFLGMNVLSGLIVVAVDGVHPTGLALFLSYVVTLGVTIVFALRMARVRGISEKLIRFTFKGFHPAMILWGLILMGAVHVVIEPLVNLFPREWYELIGDQITNGGWAMFTAIVMAPIGEEILFRGIIQQSLTRKRGPWSGILIASAIFGLIHLIPQQVVAGFCLGIVIGFVYYKTRSLPAVVVLHGINNALATITTLFEHEESAELTLRQMLGGGGVYWVVYLLCAALLIVSLVQVLRKLRITNDKLRMEEEGESRNS